MATIQHTQPRNYFSYEIHSIYATSENPRNSNSFQNNYERKKNPQYQEHCRETETGTLLDIII